jgi:hypothetical protein
MKQKVVFKAVGVDLGAEGEKRAAIEAALGKSNDELLSDIGSYQSLYEKFVKNEHVTVEFDTDEGSATVVSV